MNAAKTLRAAKARWRWLAAAAFAATLGVAVARDQFVAPLDTQVAALRRWQPPGTCTIYDRDGQLIDRFYRERRERVSLQSLPDHAWQAVLAAEDRRFFDHGGVDVAGVLRALKVNLAAGQIREGGSTLTQQLVKNALLDDERSLDRKLREAALAWRLEKQLSKQEILELYINFVYLGEGSYGLAAAAEEYFGVAPAALTAGQAALLAGLIPAPTLYSPRSAPERAAQQRDRVLEGMVDAGYLSAAQAANWLGKPAEVLPARPADPPPVGRSYLTAVRKQARELAGEERLLAAEARIHTALDRRLQAVAAGAVAAAADAVMARQGRIAISGRLRGADLERFLAEGAGLPRDAAGELQEPPVGSCFPATILAPGQPLRAGPYAYPLPAAVWGASARDPGNGARTLAGVARRGDLLPVCRGEDGAVRPQPRPWVQGAAAVIENATGEVVALVGGVDEEMEGFNRATQARRQPGSSFKPYIYATALAQGRSPFDTVLDAPLEIDVGGPEPWRPTNYGERYANGPVTLRRALASSYNTAAIRLAQEVGLPAVAETAAAMGVKTPLRPTLPMALGASEVTVLDQAAAYSAIARMGLARDPVLITRVEDGRGRALARAGEVLDARGARLPGGPGRQALPPAAAAVLADMLQETLRAGTGRDAWAPGQARAGKTGTTNDFVDAWFVGFTPRYTVAVWIGADDHSPLGPEETGARAALPAWLAIVESLPSDPSFPWPPQAVLVPYDGQVVVLPRASSRTWRYLPAQPGPDAKL